MREITSHKGDAVNDDSPIYHDAKSRRYFLGEPGDDCAFYESDVTEEALLAIVADRLDQSVQRDVGVTNAGDIDALHLVIEALDVLRAARFAERDKMLAEEDNEEEA